jgi:hypothetical protein
MLLQQNYLNSKLIEDNIMNQQKEARLKSEAEKQKIEEELNMQKLLLEKEKLEIKKLIEENKRIEEENKKVKLEYETQQLLLKKKELEEMKNALNLANQTKTSINIEKSLKIIQARYGWRNTIWDDVPFSHANGIKDVTDICTRNIQNNELHLNPERRGQVFNQLFWPETASGPAIARKVGIR